MKKLKAFPKFENLEKDFPFCHYNEKTEKVVYDPLPVQALVRYIINKKLVGKTFFKDYAELKSDEIFDTNKGMIKIYNEELGIFKVADEFLKKIIYEFFSEEETKQMQKCCKFNFTKSPDEAIRKIILPGLKYEINRVLEKLGNHWNSSFYKGFLSICFKNGTLILNTKKKKWKFLLEKKADFLATTYFNAEFTSNIAKKHKNRLFEFLKFKLNLDTEEKEKFIKAILFDWFYIENKSHHILCLCGKNSSGKSSFMEHLKSFEYFNTWCSTINLSSLVGSKFSVPDWFYSNNIICNETSERYFKDNATFKQLVAKEVLSVEQKGIDPIFLRAFSKLICLGEDPIRIKNDGGTDKRIINLNFSENKFEFTENERYSYINYYKNIKENDTTDEDALLQFLAFEKYEDLTQIIISGFEEFCAKNYQDNKRSFKNEYEKIFTNEMEKYAKMQMPYLEEYENYFEPCKNSCVLASVLIKIVNNLSISNISVVNTLKEQLEMLIIKIPDYSDIKEFTSKNKSVKVKVEEKDQETGKSEYTILRKNKYFFGIRLKPLEEIRYLILNNRNLIGNNHIEKYNNMRDAFKTVDESDYNKLFEIEEKKEDNFPHGQEKNITEVEEDLKNLLN